MHTLLDARAWLTLYFFFFLSTGESTDTLEISTQYGKVRGFAQNTIVGNDVNVFLGIPYGASTDGENRFGPPKEAIPWDGTLDVTQAPQPCFQVILKEFRNDILSPAGEASDDCLKLSIWAPKHGLGNSPVMVWIHGGGFACGSANLQLYNGAVLAAQEDVVVVAINYRLSGFGFLYLDHPLAPGNVGLMDQTLALKWVKNNIKGFGGDPAKVTIFGESAGGASVGFHLLLPGSLDLFKNAILQSGTAANLWATSKPEVALENALLLAERAGCPTQKTNREETIRCLQGMSGDNLLKVMLTIEDKPLKLMYLPVIDGNFLSSHPSNQLSNGKFCNEKNVLIGFTKADGGFMIPVFAPQLELTEDSVYTEEQIRHAMSYLTKHNKVINDEQLHLVKFMYTDWDSTPEDRISARRQVVHYLTDRWIACGAIEYANKMSDRGNQIFMYRFDHILKNQTAFLKVPNWVGSSHGDELPLVFGHALRSNDNQESRLAKQVMRYWANFARQGDPNDGYLPEWPKYTTQKKLRLNLDSETPRVDKTDRQKECAFWDEIFSKTESLAMNEVRK